MKLPRYSPSLSTECRRSAFDSKNMKLDTGTHEVIRPTEAIPIPGLGQPHTVFPPIRGHRFLSRQLLLPLSDRFQGPRMSF
jgi:hypothetical protein